MKQSKKTNEEMWWDNLTKVKEFLQFALKKQLIDDMNDFLEHPEKYNREYLYYLEDKEKTFTFKKNKTQEFFDERFYPINNEQYESLNTILWAYPSQWLTKLMGDLGTAEVELRKRIKGERGSRVHDALQKNSIVKREDFDDEEWLSLIHAYQWIKEYNPKMILNEEWCWSVKHHFATRLDRIVEIDNKIWLIDWKTGYVGDEAWLQLVGTKLCAEETFPITIERWGIVSLNANVRAGWKFYRIDERNDVVEEATSLGSLGDKNALEQAIENSYQRDINVLHALHEVWKHAFRNVKPKRYPMDTVPEELNISIESIDKRYELVEKIKEKHEEAKTLPMEQKEQEIAEKNDNSPVVPTLPPPNKPIETAGESLKKEIEEKEENVAHSELTADKLYEEVKELNGKEIDKWIDQNKNKMMKLNITEMVKFQKLIRTNKKVKK